MEILESHSDETLTVEQLAFFACPEPISRSAIYRNLSELEAEGLVKRITLPLPQKTGFRYVGANECRKHLHLECEKCGKTFHLALPASNELIDNVMRDAGFEVDRKTTVLSGVCSDCRKN
ncbi:MAG: transcriptional repressor [Clostridia bacterium]|nr:transcriptional repressor [Clostridia bacterium]